MLSGIIMTEPAFVIIVSKFSSYSIVISSYSSHGKEGGGGSQSMLAKLGISNCFSIILSLQALFVLASLNKKPCPGR